MYIYLLEFEILTKNQSLVASYDFCAGVSVVLVFRRYKELLDREAQLKEREREMDRQRQEMEAEAQRRLESERELERLKDDSDR